MDIDVYKEASIWVANDITGNRKFSNNGNWGISIEGRKEKSEKQIDLRIDGRIDATQEDRERKRERATHN